MIVFIKTVPDRESAYNIHEWTNDSSGKKMRKTKVGNRAKTKIQAFYSGAVGGLKNGLSYKPWLDDKGVQKVEPETGRKLTLQDREEEKWGLPKGFLTNKAWRKGDSLKDEDLTYFQKKVWALKEGTTMLDTSVFDDAMLYYVALDSKLIANSEKEYREHQWPKATHYIALENESDELQFKKNKAKSEAMAKLHHEDMTPTMKKKFVAILDLSSTKTNLTEELTHNLLFDFIQNSNHRPGSNLDKFNQLFTQLETPDGRERIEARYLLKRALDNRIVFEKQGGFHWPKADGKITLGENYSETIDFLTNPKKDALVEDLQAEIDLKSK